MGIKSTVFRQREFCLSNFEAACTQSMQFKLLVELEASQPKSKFKAEIFKPLKIKLRTRFSALLTSKLDFISLDGTMEI